MDAGEVMITSAANTGIPPKATNDALTTALSVTPITVRPVVGPSEPLQRLGAPRKRASEGSLGVGEERRSAARAGYASRGRSILGVTGTIVVAALAGSDCERLSGGWWAQPRMPPPARRTPWSVSGSCTGR